jgi:Rieske Fe-S protein
MNRREFLRSFIVTAALVGTAAAGIVELSGLYERNQSVPVTPPVTSSTTQQSTGQVTSGSTGSSASSSQQGSTSSVPNGYVFIQTLSALGGKTYEYFSHPTFGSSILVNVGGQWKAFSSVCTHRPCTVQYPGSSLYCPCHGGTFSPADGSVTGGPPPSPLPEYAVLIQNSNVYVGNVTIN